MENYINSLNAVNKVKQPKPDIKEAKNQQKKIELPHVGVIDVPKSTLTPLEDTVAIKRQENPHIIYRFIDKNHKFLNLNNVLSMGIISCGIAGFISVLKAIKK